MSNNSEIFHVNLSALPPGATGGHLIVNLSWLNTFPEHEGSLRIHELFWTVYVGDGTETNLFPPPGGTKVLMFKAFLQNEPFTEVMGGGQVRGITIHDRDETHGQHSADFSGLGVWLAAQGNVGANPASSASIAHIFTTLLVFS